ncbi:MAG TPA: peptidoglycan DD-metalloendopeptidase family protein [Thermodesulfobacteriota bacterium]|nr:peptidoglycan DD-metalloendopeptidase family protein [Thermodesulfobacteriota bacterium]
MEPLESGKLDRLGGRPFEGKRKRRRWILFSGSLLVVLSFVIYFFIIPSTPPPPPVAAPAAVSPTSQEPPVQTIEGEVKGRSTLFQSLSEKGIPHQWIDLIILKLKPYVNFRKIKGGTYRYLQDMRGELVKFIYEASPTDIYEIEKDFEGYRVQRKNVPLESRLVKVVGEIRSSLFEAMEAAGEQDPLTIAFAEILAWEIDFYKDVREGDRFKVVVEKMYKGDQFIQYGPIRAVEYQRGERILRGIRYKEGYYNEKGVSLRKAFLKVPLRFNRISSKFSQARKHPILGGLRPHYGVDYAAPPGTPIWAVADGTVTSCGWNGGFGNQVILRHVNGYVTYYGHLSAFGSGVRRGTRVNQKQIIGYVGSTGLSTGPHLDYRITKDGQFRNPLTEVFPAGLPIEKGEMEAFQQTRGEMAGWLEGDSSDPRPQGTTGMSH